MVMPFNRAAHQAVQSEHGGSCTGVTNEAHISQSKMCTCQYRLTFFLIDYTAFTERLSGCA